MKTIVFRLIKCVKMTCKHKKPFKPMNSNGSENQALVNEIKFTTDFTIHFNYILFHCKMFIFLLI